MKKIVSVFSCALFSSIAFAQDAKKIDGNWFASPWVWVIGAAVFILLLVALTRGGRRD